ncbi:reverse transcriptase [Caerostris darwini]|uniref:Reverse transcriptase n=1 Tax=Caerostris darwini TaxID=1538125 RepID=A0AAV4RQ38_9ARAC|nr:reverse transcriptase [Caerostris darwini]
MDAGNDYPVASKVIRENFYVNDLLLSMNNPEEITQVCRKLSFSLWKRGFELRKWRSNSSDVLRRLNVTTEEENFEIHAKIIRILAYCRRFIIRCKLGTNIASEATYLYLSEIKSILFRHFPDELNSLQTGKTLSPSNKILSLNPFLDNGILRAGGRIRRSNLPFKSKHPILLPGSHKISAMIIQEAHIANLHAGQLTLLAHILKQSYWIVGAKRLTRKIVNKCVVCCRYYSKPVKQLLGDLSKARVEFSRAFTNCGCDFTGSIDIKLAKRRGKKSTKAYVALFVGLATKALHLELVGDLTSGSFISALKRFTSRRVYPSRIYCDNATNFIGARRKIDDVQEFINTINDNPKITYFLNTSEINWHFIPSSPHFGGIWEDGTKSVKFHLKRSISDCKLTFEEFSTLLCQIEAILNSRPLVSPGGPER